MDSSLELHNLSAEPLEEWRRMLRFINLNADDRSAMVRTSETLLGHAKELVVQTYDYLRSVPETASILGWTQEVDEEHLEERRRFFTIWLTRTLGLDISEEFAYYLFRAGQYHASHGPRHIHTPSAYVTASISLVLAAFASYMAEANLSSNVLAQAMAGWNKYLSVQLNQMLLGYQVALEFEKGDIPIHITTFGRLRPLVGKSDLSISAENGADVSDLLRKFFNYFPQARAEALERIWRSEENSDSLWIEVNPIYIPQQGWRVLLNGRDLNYEGGFRVNVRANDEIAIFPPGR